MHDTLFIVFCLEPSEAQGIAYDKDRAEAHGQCSDHRIHFQTKGKIKYSGCDRDSDDIIDERPEQVLLNVSDHRLTELDRC